jgi:hypothetical protein
LLDLRIIMIQVRSTHLFCRDSGRIFGTSLQGTAYLVLNVLQQRTWSISCTGKVCRWVGSLLPLNSKVATANYLFTPQLTAQICIMAGGRGIINYGLGFGLEGGRKARLMTRTGFYGGHYECWGETHFKFEPAQY